MNTNSFRTRFSTLKRKVSSLQLEHGLLPDYLLMVKNNVQKENVPNPATNAGKYMLKCSGQVEEVLKTSFGLRFNSSSMVMMANNFDFTEEKLDEEVVGEVKHRADEVEDEGRVELIGNLKVAIQSFKTRCSGHKFVKTLGNQRCISDLERACLTKNIIFVKGF